MSSCFLCDCSIKFYQNTQRHFVATGLADPTEVGMYMQEVPIIKGSAVDKNATLPNNVTYTDQQHTNNNKQNYVSYNVQRIEFEMYPPTSYAQRSDAVLNDYVLIFKIPFKIPVFDYYFYDLRNFMLYKQPECVLGYKILQNYCRDGVIQERPKKARNCKIVVDKPFVLGPNDYVGVFYMFNSGPEKRINASAKVWFDVV